MRGGGDKEVCPVNGAEDVNSKAVPIEGLYDKTTLVLTGCLWVRSTVLEGQDGPNQQEGGSKERPPARNKEERDARHRQQHRPHDGSEQRHHRADKADQDHKQTEKEVRRVSCDPGDSAQDV